MTAWSAEDAALEAWRAHLNVLPVHPSTLQSEWLAAMIPLFQAAHDVNRPVPSPGSVEAVARPDFGEDRQEFHGTILTCKRIAPGLTLPDLVMAFDRGKSEAETGDDAAGNPSRWPVIRGIKAVTDAILDAVYGPEGLTTSRAPSSDILN